MAVDVTITGNGHYAGAKSAISGYSVQEDATPIMASDTFGGAGQIQFSAIDDPSRFGTMLIYGNPVSMNDGARGTVAGTINSITSNEGVLSVSAASLIGNLVVTKPVPPVHDTFYNVIALYLSLVGISTFAMDASLASIPIVAPGFTGDLYSHVKDLLIYTGSEMTMLNATITVRAVRQRRAFEMNNHTVAWSVGAGQLAQSISVNYYNSVWNSNALAYPQGGWTEDTSVYTIDLGQRTTVNIPVNISLVSVQQPTCVSTVSQYYNGPSSVYSVAGNDGSAIDPVTWNASGGKVSVAIGKDGQSLDITMVAPYSGYVTALAPFRIGVSTGANAYYSSLRIMGSGVFQNMKTVTVPTGADPLLAPDSVGITVDNIYVNTYDDATRIALGVSAAYAAPLRTLHVSKADINKPGEQNPNYIYATLGDFDAYATANSIATLAQFDTAWAGKKVSDFDAYWFSKTANTFDHQVFGNAAGARVQYRRAMYRIKSATITDSGVSYDAEADTTLGDFDASATGMTLGQFDTSYTGMTIGDFALIPLPVVNPEYDRV